MAYDLKVPKAPGAQAGKRACGRSGLIKGGGHLASCGSLLYIKPTAGHVTWGDQASHARPNGHSNFSRSRRPHYIRPAGRGETQPKKTLTIASQAKGDSFQRKTFRHFPEKFSPFSTYHNPPYRYSFCFFRCGLLIFVRLASVSMHLASSGRRKQVLSYDFPCALRS